MIQFFICGSALRGQPDHGNLGDARFIREVKSAPRYRLHSVKDGWHPGIYEVDRDGVAIAGELYEMTPEQHAELIAGEPPDMYQAEIALEDGSTALAMLFPRQLVDENEYPDISHFGGWAAYKASVASLPRASQK